MQKPANRILSALLVLVMVLSMLPATVFATGETANALKGWNIILGDDIGVKFTLNSADYTVITTVNGAEVTPAISGETVTVNVAAAQMTDTIGLTVKSGEETVHTGEYSVREYADTILGGSYDAEVKDMVKQMLNYGAAAQTYFNYAEDKLANDGITVDAAVVPTAVPEIAVEDNLDGISLYGMSLVFRNKIAVRFYFNVTGDINSFTFSQGTPVEKNGLYYVEVAGINPQDMAKDITLNVNDGALSVTYSPMTYMVRQYNSEKSAAALKSLVQAMYGYHQEAMEYQEYQKIAQLGHLSAHADKAPWKVSDEVTYFKAALNVSVPQEGDYSPLSEDAIKLVRGGVEYNVAIVGQNALVLDNSNAQCLIKLSNANLSGNLMPAQANDYLIIEGRFKYWAGNVVQISKTYVYFDGANVEVSTTVPVLPSTVEGSVMSKHSVNGWASNGVYAVMAENAAPGGDWSYEYSPVASENLKLIRGGETYNIGFPGRGTLVKYSATEYFLKMEWNVGEYAPMQDGDILIVEGGFINNASKVTLNIPKTYIYANGSNVEFSTEMPKLPTTVEGGVMMKVDGYGWTGGTGDLIFKMDNTAPNGGYKPTSAGNIKLIRNGETYDIAYVGQNVINKDNDSWYNIPFWTIVNYKPMLANDILVIEGDFYQESTKTTLNVSKTYVLLNEDGSAEFSTEMPTLPTTVEGGVMMKVDGYGWTGGTGDLIFKMDNTAPNGGYKPTSAGNIKLIRNGETYDVAYVGVEIFNKSNDGWYTIPFWTIVNYKPMLANDILVIEGDFYQESTKTTLNVSKTYVLLKDGGAAEFFTEMPSQETVVDCGVMSEHAEGNASEIYFTLAENSIPVDEEANYPYTGTVQLVSGSNTSNVNASIIKLDVDMYYLELDGAELSDGSYLIVEGAFSNADNGYTMNISKTYVLADGENLVFSTTEPEIFTKIYAGTMSAHASNGWNGDALYFSMAENEAPIGDAIRYKPAAESNIKLIRDGATYDVGHTARETIVKASETGYYIALWVLGDYKPLKANDILIVEGDFTNANQKTLNIIKTYILINADGTARFSTEMPTLSNIINAGMMSAHSSNGWNGDALYFSMAENAAPIGDAIRYKPAAASNIKLIRDGATYDVGHTARETIVKASETGYYIALWVLGDYKPLKANDILIVEGDFTNAANNTTLNISKTYILINADGTARFSTEMPTLSNIINAGMMSAHSSNGWNGDALYFSMAENAAPIGDAIRYKPAAESNIKLIRDGATYDVGHTARETIVKASETGYYIALWVLGDYKPLKANDILIVEGDFTNAANNTTLNISKTYILINADGTATYSDTEPVLAVQGGMMQEVTGYGWSSSEADYGSVIFKMSNDAPNGNYQPTSVSNIKLIRDGVTYDVARMDADVVIKSNADWYTIPIWTIVDFRPLRANDILIVEGLFKHTGSDTMLNITKTYVLLNADGSASFSATEPVIGPEITHGLMNVTNWQKPASNPDGSANDGGLYFTLAENDVIYTTDWATQYKPVSADVIKLIRGGVETNVANTGVGMIIKYSATDYYLQFWPITQKPMQAGDIMIVEGKFKNDSNGSVLNITKTYILFNENGTVSVYENSPMVIDAGVIGAYTQGWFNNGFFFTMEANNAPAGSLDENNGGDWTVEYTPSSAAVIKLVRDGVATEIAMVDRGTITKLTDTVYYFRIDDWATPYINNKANLRDGDMLVVEGEFYGKPENAGKGYTLNISKSYIIFTSMEDEIITFSTGAETEFGEVVLPNSGDTLNIGMWNGSYHVFEDKQLKQLQDAGITKIMGIDTQWIGTTDVEGWLDRVYSYGIQVIIDLRTWDGETVPSYVNHPALIGFLMYDEPCATDFDALAELKTKFDAVMPADTLFYVNLYGSSAAGTSLMGALDWALGRRDYDQYYVQKFLDKLDIEVLSWDSYALLEGSGIRTGYFSNFDVMASKDVPLWYTMLSSGHKTTATYYTVPTAEELRWQMAVAMTYGISNIDHYTYVSHEDDYSCMVEYGTWEPTDLYYDIKDVDNEYLAWDNIYMAYDWVGVGTYDAGNTNEMFSNLKNALDWKNYGVSGIQASEDLLVGVFEYNGENAYMITNAGTPGSNKVGDGKDFIMGDTTVTLTLDAADYKCVAIIDQGEISYVAVENNTVTIDVEAYEGVFVIPVLN